MKITRKAIVSELRNPASIWQTWILTATVALAYLVRAWPYFIKPQFYAEDGTVWISKAVSDGVTTLIPKTYNGFFHYPDKLYSLIVVHISLYWAPAIFAVTAWALFIMMVYYMFSQRTKILTTNFERLFMVFALAMIANFNEFFFNFSNSIFLMGIIGALILVAKKPKTLWIDIPEKIFFILTCMALPFSWIYVPIALFDRIKYKTKNGFYLIVSAITAVAQFIGYETSHTERSPVTLASLLSKWAFLEIYNQIVIPAVRFARVDIPVWEMSASHYPLAIVGLTMIALLIASIAVLRKANRQVLLFLLFLAGMTFASLKSPTVHLATATAALQRMAAVADGNRYFIYGILAVNLIFIKAAVMTFKQKALYIFIGLFMAFGLASSIRYGSIRVHKHWQDYTAQYQQGVRLFENGQKQVIIPENPQTWSMGLFRKN